MRERVTGAIVQMSSIGRRFTFPGVGAYSATKFALEGWSEALAKEVERFGIRVLIVEPGAFRTSFNGPGALLLSKRIPAYDEQIEPLRTGMPDDDGKQPGDPAKAAAAILLALDSPDPPLRLALGNDAVDAIAESLDGAKAELAAWERVGRSAVFDYRPASNSSVHAAMDCASVMSPSRIIRSSCARENHSLCMSCSSCSRSCSPSVMPVARKTRPRWLLIPGATSSMPSSSIEAARNPVSSRNSRLASSIGSRSTWPGAVPCGNSQRRMPSG